MKSSLTRILLPVTMDSGFEKASRLALNLAKETGAEISLAVIDDDSEPYERTPLPFHEKSFIHNISHSEEISDGAVNDLAAKFLTKAFAEGQVVREVLVRGHTATQILLLSRFHDLIVLADNAQFPFQNTGPNRSVNPIFEILDQTVIPVLMVGSDAKESMESAAILLDGGPCSTLALHSLAALFTHKLDIPISVCVSLIQRPIADRLFHECDSFLCSKGYTNLDSKFSAEAPWDALTAGDFGDSDLIALGIRSRHMYHDLHIGQLAERLSDSKPGLCKLFS